MTDQLYVPEKPKLNLGQKIIGYGALGITIFFFFLLIVSSFLFNTFSESKFQINSILLIIGFTFLQFLIFYLFFKRNTNRRTDFDANLKTGGINIPKPLGPLSPDQVKILTRLHSFSYSMHRAFWFLIPLFLAFDIFIIIPIMRYGINIMSFMVIIITLMMQGVMIHYGQRHYLYYLDLINPIFQVRGESSLIRSGRNTTYIIVNGITFPINSYQDTNIINRTNTLKSGEMLKINYSPHSKYIWEIVILETSVAN